MQPTPTSDHRLAAKARVLSLIQALTSQSSEALGPLDRGMPGTGQSYRSLPHGRHPIPYV